MLLTLMMAGNFFFAMNYSLVGYLYFIPTYLLWGVLMAVGLAWLAAGVARIAGEWSGAISPRVGVSLVALCVVASISYLTLSRYQAIDQSGQTATRDKALALLSAAPQGASLYLDWEDLSVIRFYRMVYGMRTDTSLYSGDPTDWPKGIYCDTTNGTAVYVGKFAGQEQAVVARDFTLESAPIGWRVSGVKAGAGERYAVPPCGLCATCR
jgi:hypothetical protein